jgi:DNA repair protein RecN (Recombination protein N)
MLRRLAIRDFVIVHVLELEFNVGFSVLTGETGAGKSILIDALQLALGSRAEAGVVREGALRSDISAEFDVPASLMLWLEEADIEAPDSLLLRRTIDRQGKSRAWINGSAATASQLREVADHLVDIHGQHAWQNLTRTDSVRDLLDVFGGIETHELCALWGQWRAASSTLTLATQRHSNLADEHERLTWQLGELDKLRPGLNEWPELEAEHNKAAHAQALVDAAQEALACLSQADHNAEGLTGRAIVSLQEVAAFDIHLGEVIEVLQSAQTQLQDAAHTLGSYLKHTDPNPQRLRQLEERLSAWVALARRFRCTPDELPKLALQWQTELQALNFASDIDTLQRLLAQARQVYEAEALRVSAARGKAAPRLGAAVTQTMQGLGMQGGCFEVALLAEDAPQAFGMDHVEFLVAGHAGSTPKPLGRVASGGELSRIALAIAVTTAQLSHQQSDTTKTLIFDEIDAGVGGAVAESVGRLMKQLGCTSQVFAVTHLPQVAACADHHFVVSKQTHEGFTRSEVHGVLGEARVAEVARMLGGERLSNTRIAHAQEMLTEAVRPQSLRKQVAKRLPKPS